MGGLGKSSHLLSKTMRRQRSESHGYRAAVAYFRATYPNLGSHLCAAWARSLERDDLLTRTRLGRVFVRTNSNELIPLQ